MKINNKIIRLKRYTKSLFYCERSAAILFALVLVLSLGMLTIPAMANISPEPTFDLDTNSHLSGATNAIYTFTMTNIVDGSTNEQLKQITATIPSGYTINPTYITTTAGTKVGTMTMSGGGDTHSADLVTTTIERVFTATYSGTLCGTLTLSGDGQTATLVIERAVYGLARTQGALESIAGFFINPTTAGIYSWSAKALGYGESSTEQDCSPRDGYSQDVQIGLVHNQTTGFDYPTIQSAIDGASSGNTINVADGTYTITSKILVDKSVTITGNTGSPSSVVVTYAAPSQTLDCFDMQANNVTVQGISAVNGRYGFNFAATDPTGGTISNCVIDHCYEGAINIDGGSGHTISDNTITHCLTSGTKSGVVYIYGCPDTTIDGNTLTDNGLTGAHATMGIYVKFTYPSSSSERVEVINNNISGMLGQNADIQVYNAPYTYIYNNTISNSEDKGIAIFGIDGNPAYTGTANRVEVIGNTISSTYYPGMQAANSPYTYFYDNTLTQCNYYGGDSTGDFDYASIHIDVGSVNCLIDSNTVSDGINGIQLWSDDCTVTNNTIYNMGLTYAGTKTTTDGTYYNSAILYGDMYDVNMPTSATISNNNIYDNYWGLFVISAYTGTVTAEENWWGAASGPTHASNPGAIGDAVSDNVDFNPFLSPNVTVTKTGPTTANQGNNITYTITYKNVGTFNATNVVITETYPSEVEYVSADPEPDTDADNNDKWTINSLAPGAEDTITVTVHIK